MRKLATIGRIFYGLAIGEIGFQAIYCRDFPYMMLPPNYVSIPGFAAIACVFGFLCLLAGACIVFERRARPASLLLGTGLLLIFCFYFVPYALMVSPNNRHFGDWENSAKELALAGGAFIVARCYPRLNNSTLTRLLGKLLPIGVILFPVTIISFGIDHFLYAKQAADYVPSWAPYHLFWMYFCGVALLGSGIAIILKIQTGVIAALLGTMIFIWFISLHTPRMIASSAADLPGEITSAILALAYSGIAFVIVGTAKK
jgi:uncharacterized membrane protein